MRYLGLKIFAGLIILVAALFIWKWNTWFKKYPEADYICPNSPNRIIQSLGANADYDRAISWRCDTVPHKSFLELYDIENGVKKILPAKHKKVSTMGGKNVFYRVDLKNLQAKDYKYRVQTGDKYSKWYKLSLNKVNNKVRFAYLGDIQDLVGGVSDTIFRHINRRFPKLDFWMFGGDCVERPMDKYWNEFILAGDSIFQNKPVIACTGNHEYIKALFKILDKRWKYYWPLPKNGAKLFKGRVAHWEIEDACIVSLDTDGVQGLATYFSQYYWAKRIFKETDKKWKIIFMHHPIKSAGKGRSTIIMSTLFANMLEEMKVDLILQGHDHSYSRYITKEDGKLSTPVYVESSCSRKFYDVVIDEEADRLGSSIKLFQILDISKDTLQYKSYKLSDEIYDSFKIIKTDKGIKVIDENPKTKEHLVPTHRIKRKKTKLEEYLKEASNRNKLKYSL